MAFDESEISESFADAQIPRGVRVDDETLSFGSLTRLRDGLTDSRGFGRVDTPNKQTAVKDDRRTIENDNTTRRWLSDYIKAERERRRIAWKSRCRARRKLTDAQVIEIRTIYKASKPSHKSLSKQYGVSQPTIFLLLTGVSYRDSGGPIYWPERGYSALQEDGR